MKIDLNAKLLNFKEEEIKDEKGEAIEARTIIANALVAEDREHPLTAEKKNEAFQIGLKLYSKEPDFTVNQLAFMKERVGLFYNALIYGRICEIIEKK